MRVAVIGASGGMGSFFVRYFLEKGDSVRVSDLPRRTIKRPTPTGASGTGRGYGRRFSAYRTSAEAVRRCDVTIIAVPMDSTLKVAEEVAPVLKRGSTLVEISSVKGQTLPALRKLVGDRVNVLSIHPLFGPALESTEGMKIAVIVRKNKQPREKGGVSDLAVAVKKPQEKGGVSDLEAGLAKRLFPGARVIPMSRKEHDRAMAVVLTLTHMMNVVYAATVSQFLTPVEFMKVSTPNSSMQLTLAEAVLAQDAGLSFAIQAGNPYSKKVARAASRELRRMIEMVDSSDRKAFDEHFSRLAKTYRSDKRASAVIREIYSAAEKAA